MIESETYQKEVSEIGYLKLCTEANNAMTVASDGRIKVSGRSSNVITKGVRSWGLLFVISISHPSWIAGLDDRGIVCESIMRARLFLTLSKK